MGNVRRQLFAGLVLLVALLSVPGVTQAAPACRYQLGFAVLAGLIPAQVGTCLDSEAHNPANGDALQHTTKGLLVWRKADNLTAFTDGYQSWINGPYGLQERLNTQRFSWESDAGAAGLPIVYVRAIAIAAPVAGAIVSSPVEVRGRVAVTPFEATLAYRIYDHNGRLVGRGPLMVNGELGKPGTFRAALPFADGAGLPGRIEILDLSPKDGSVLANVSVEVRLG